MNAYSFLKITFLCCLFYLMLIFSNTMEIEYKYKLKILNPSRVGLITIPYTDHPLNVNSTLFYLELLTCRVAPVPNRTAFGPPRAGEAIRRANSKTKYLAYGNLFSALVPPENGNCWCCWSRRKYLLLGKEQHQ